MKKDIKLRSDKFMIKLGKTEKKIIIELLNGSDNNKNLSKKLKVKSVQGSLNSLRKKGLIEGYKDYVAYGISNPKLERFLTYRLTIRGVDTYNKIKQQSILQYKSWLNKHYSDNEFIKKNVKEYDKKNDVYKASKSYKNDEANKIYKNINKVSEIEKYLNNNRFKIFDKYPILTVKEK